MPRLQAKQQFNGTPGLMNSLAPGTAPRLFYGAQEWSFVKLSQPSTGTVVVGTNSSIRPVANGGGVAISESPYWFIAAPGTTLVPQIMTF
jgi:hypothetical protein